MMESFAVISDIHSNFLALEAVVSQLRESGPDIVYCLGDVVGYGAEPNECVDAVREIADGRTIYGNHDVAAVHDDPDYADSFNPQAAAAVRYQRQNLTEKNVSWLKSLPENMHVEDYLLYHGSPIDTDHYLMNISDLELAMDYLPADLEFVLLFVGHTHLPTAVGIGKDGSIEVDLKTETNDLSDIVLYLEEGRRYLVNPGSIGQPRDRNPDAAYVTVDMKAGQLRFRRVDYDVKEAQRRIIEAGLPDFLSQRLEHGV